MTWKTVAALTAIVLGAQPPLRRPSRKSRPIRCHRPICSKQTPTAAKPIGSLCLIRRARRPRAVFPFSMSLIEKPIVLPLRKRGGCSNMPTEARPWWWVSAT